jgi:hypothetical protein
MKGSYKMSLPHVHTIHRIEYVYGGRGRQETWINVSRAAALRDAKTIADTLEWTVEVFEWNEGDKDDAFKKVATLKPPASATAVAVKTTWFSRLKKLFN